MNKEQLFLEIDEIYSEWHGGDLYIGKERENRIKLIIEEALNYTRCCETLTLNKELHLAYEQTILEKHKSLDDLGKEYIKLGFLYWQLYLQKKNVNR